MTYYKWQVYVVAVSTLTILLWLSAGLNYKTETTVIPEVVLKVDSAINHGKKDIMASSSNYNVHKESRDQGKVEHYTFSKSSTSPQILYQEAMHLLASDASFRNTLMKVLTESPYQAYFWETPPVTEGTISERVFEFVLVNSNRLAGVPPDTDAFVEHFTDKNKSVVTFPNLGHDAVLVAPCPEHSSPQVYAHLASFTRGAPVSQQHLFWQEVGGAVLKEVHKLGGSHLWLSTSGLGVYWLHVRLDTYPKYYTYGPYRKK